MAAMFGNKSGVRLLDLTVTKSVRVPRLEAILLG